MSLRLLSARIVRSAAPLQKAASMSIFRGYATKKFTHEHEWISVENGLGTVGITDFAQNSLGEIVYVELPGVGSDVEAGAACGAIESVKAASDIISPVSGHVVEANDAVVEENSILNASPESESEGWLYRVKLSNEKELDDLLDHDAYTKFCEAEQ
ncbi:hypothetical protein [Absidia glauca]|uniref:Glycine cleavage system H protein n=1 Tax=Absidia glauca TaxID=4829 RepID=A0A163KL55_ABSGL|nr:hypothetical protein [Absidia glauca]